MSAMLLMESLFTYSGCKLFTKVKEGIRKTEDSRYIYQNELNKACFQHGMTYGDFKDLPRRTAYDKVLHDKTFDVVNNLKYDRYQNGLPQMEDYQTEDYQKNDTNQLLENLKNRKCTHLLEIIFGMLI